MALFDVAKKIPSNLLSDRFIVPPFTVFDTKQGYWQSRKRDWINLGITSELGRDIGKHSTKDGRKTVQLAFTRGGDLTEPIEGGGKNRFGRVPQPASIFDPVLCEITYKWFNVCNGNILDPFAGGSVRGIVAGAIKQSYFGCDLSEQQVVANRKNYKEISSVYDGIVEPIWVVGDSKNIGELFSGKKFDLMFSCPPYYNLEVYSTNENDLSYKRTYKEFLDDYEHIINECYKLLNNDSFAIFVVSNLRDDSGIYYDFVGDTIRAFEKSGFKFYNDAIVVNVAGTLPIRTPGQFNRSRKLGRQHQNYLVFYKGNPDNIKDKFGSYE